MKASNSVRSGAKLPKNLRTVWISWKYPNGSSVSSNRLVSSDFVGFVNYIGTKIVLAVQKKFVKTRESLKLDEKRHGILYSKQLLDFICKIISKQLKAEKSCMPFTHFMLNVATVLTMCMHAWLGIRPRYLPKLEILIFKKSFTLSTVVWAIFARKKC